jgi:hypothetical protein
LHINRTAFFCGVPDDSRFRLDDSGYEKFHFGRLQGRQSWIEADYLSGSQLKNSTTEYLERQGDQTPDGVRIATNMYDLRAAYKALIRGFVRKEGVSGAAVQGAALDAARANDV